MSDIVKTNNGFMQIDTLENAIKCAEYICNAGLCPKQYLGKPADIVIAWQMGFELNLKPMQALQNIAVINGRPCVWGDAVVAICRQAHDFEYINEEFDEVTKTATCRSKRRNQPEVVRAFSEQEAKEANLLNKEGPWRTYKKRMIQMRARGFSLRDNFQDLLKGIITVEEAQDMDPIDYSNVGTTIEGKNITQELSDYSSINLSKAAEIKNMIRDASSSEKALCDYYKVGKIEEMTTAMAVDAEQNLKKKLNKITNHNNKINKILREEVEEVKEAVNLIGNLASAVEERSESKDAYDW